MAHVAYGLWQIAFNNMPVTRARFAKANSAAPAFGRPSTAVMTATGAR